MGEDISWLAVANDNKVETLKNLGLKDTCKPDPNRDSMLSAATLKTGWTIIFSRKFDWIDQGILNLAIRYPSVVAVIEADHASVYRTTLYEDGELTWVAGYDGELKTQGYIFDLQEAIKRCRADWEDDEFGFGDGVGMCDVPVELAFMACGFRRLSEDQTGEFPAWTRVEPLS